MAWNITVRCLTPDCSSRPADPPILNTVEQRRSTRRAAEGGFTLIELLVVVIVIGILAAIAIPVLLSQRQRAVDASSQSDIRNLATQIETWAVDHPNGYANLNTAALAAAGIKVKASKGDALYIVQHTANGYCLAAYNTGGSPAPPAQPYIPNVEWWYDSQSQGLQPRNTGLNSGGTGCPVTQGFATDWNTPITG